jgi:hypothetical protein
LFVVVLTKPNDDAHTPIYQAFGVPLYVIDKRDTLRFVGGASPSGETALHHVITSLIAE